MIKRVVALSLVLGLASVAQGAVNVELVPSGSTVEVYLSQTEAASQWLRLVEFRFGATDPALTVSNFQWDIGAVGHYKDEGLATGPDGVAVAYAQLAETPAEQALLPATGSSLRVATFEVTCNGPDPEYLLDVLNAGAGVNDLNGTVSYGFGMAPGDDITYLNPPGDMTGGNIMFPCALPPVVSKWESVKVHDFILSEVPPNDIPVPLEAADDLFVEPRDGGIDLVIVTFSGAVDRAAAENPANISIVGCGFPAPPDLSGHSWVPTLRADDVTLEIAITPTLPDQAKYTFTLSNQTSTGGAVTVNTQRVMTGLVGDIDGNSTVNALDLSAVRAAITTDFGFGAGVVVLTAPQAIRTDLDTSGVVNALDLSLDRAKTGNFALCP